MTLVVGGSSPSNYPFMFLTNLYKLSKKKWSIIPEQEEFHNVNLIYAGRYWINPKIKVAGWKKLFLTRLTFVYTFDMIKLWILRRNTWSSGMLVLLSLVTKHQITRKFISKTNARRLLSIWFFSVETILSFYNTPKDLIILRPWSLRMRRILHMLSAQIIVKFSPNKYYTPKRRIKKWLKKKYTTQSWR